MLYRSTSLIGAHACGSLVEVPGIRTQPMSSQRLDWMNIKDTASLKSTSVTQLEETCVADYVLHPA